MTASLLLSRQLRWDWVAFVMVGGVGAMMGKMTGAGAVVNDSSAP
jgi:hypothetical protein